MKLSIPIQSRQRVAVGVAIFQAALCVFILKSRVWHDAGAASHPSLFGHGLRLPKDRLLAGSSTAAFRDNLRPDVNYITSWPANGWSNQVIEFMNLIYLAQMTERVPILPRFRPVHILGRKSNVSHQIDVGDVFDLPKLERAVGMPILEWREVKDLASETVEYLGCWDIQNKTWEAERVYLDPPLDLKLDISYTRTQDWVRLASEGGGDPNMLLWPLASLIHFAARANALGTLPAPEASPLHLVSLPPDEHLFCVNSLYIGLELLEDEEDISPAWRAVGQHMHFTNRVQEIGTSYIRQTLGVQVDEPIPPYIAVHVRRGDFIIWCHIAGVRAPECLAPLSAFARRVEEMRADILERRGVNVEHVVITSDEEDPWWWDDVFELGWLRPDHSQTVERYGPWYPMFIDAIIQSSALGFVGTDTSTVSILARRRVFDRGGVTEMVRWGQPGADDH
ncbi:hypothetical protein B0H11DRAFT_1994592 [Mycena galericulata]|nr:hypothetical protein B0H11DRAFT_1994592 [Mycena galericulata]